jgi:hypothetical protein
LITAVPSISPRRIRPEPVLTSVHRDGAGGGARVECAGGVELDVAHGGLDPAVAQPPHPPERCYPGAALQM